MVRATQCTKFPCQRPMISMQKGPGRFSAGLGKTPCVIKRTKRGMLYYPAWVGGGGAYACRKYTVCIHCSFCLGTSCWPTWPGSTLSSQSEVGQQKKLDGNSAQTRDLLNLRRRVDVHLQMGAIESSTGHIHILKRPKPMSAVGKRKMYHFGRAEHNIENRTTATRPCTNHSSMHLQCRADRLPNRYGNIIFRQQPRAKLTCSNYILHGKRLSSEHCARQDPSQYGQ